jgi:hypothetical protein
LDFHTSSIAVGDEKILAFPDQLVGGITDKIFAHRDVGPKVAREDQFDSTSQTGARSEDRTALRILRETTWRQVDPLAIEVELKPPGIRRNH